MYVVSQPEVEQLARGAFVELADHGKDNSVEIT
jgi:hypothetical protein